MWQFFLTFVRFYTVRQTNGCFAAFSRASESHKWDSGTNWSLISALTGGKLQLIFLLICDLHWLHELSWMWPILSVKVVCSEFALDISVACSFCCCLQHSHSQWAGAEGGWGGWGGVPGWGERTVRESAGQKVQWSERLREEARAGGGAGQRRGGKAYCLIALSDSTPALDGFFFTLPLKRTGCAFGVKPSRKC